MLSPPQVDLSPVPSVQWAHPQLQPVVMETAMEVVTGRPAVSAPSDTILTPASIPAPRTKICVYCGSYKGNKPVYLEAARELARVMAQQNIDLVYGGGTVGLMGELAKTLVSLAGPDSVHGIIPEALVKYERDETCQTLNGDNVLVPSHNLYGRTTVVKDMHTRKQQMAQEVFDGGPGSGFIALSGGFGTLEEVLETATWNQLGIHKRGICLLNVSGYFDGLLAWVATAVREGFICHENAGIVVTALDAAGAIRALREYKVSTAAYKIEWGQQ